MKVIIVTDNKSDGFFAYVEENPAICAQGSTEAEVKQKINKHIKSFKTRNG